MFNTLKRSHARHYVEGLTEQDLVLHSSKLAVDFKAEINDKGTLVLPNKQPITFGRHVLLRMPSSLVNFGFPPVVMLYKGETFEYTSSMWNFLDEEQQTDLLNALQGEHSITIQTFSRPF
jgi:hypothetical protein